MGVEELNLANEVVIYPNSLSGNFSIKSSGIFTEDVVNVSIINILGQVIYKSKIATQKGEINLTVDKLNPAKGTYTISITCGTMEITKRLIVK